jgi:hypothetical protein
MEHELVARCIEPDARIIRLGPVEPRPSHGVGSDPGEDCPMDLPSPRAPGQAKRPFIVPKEIGPTSFRSMKTGMSRDRPHVRQQMKTRSSSL